MPRWFTDEHQPAAASSRRRSNSHRHQYHTFSGNLALDSAIQAAIASSDDDDGRSTAQGQGWGSGVGGFLSRVFSAGAARADGGKPSPDWDAHGLAVSAVPVPLARLDGKERYKVSELTFLDRRTRAAAAEDPLFVFDDDMPALRPGGVYTPGRSCATSSTLSPSPACSTTSPSKPSPSRTARSASPSSTPRPRECQQLVRRAKPCILPETLQRELQGMVKKQRKVSSGLLKRMAGRIERWYHDEGFQCAQAVSYHGNLDTGEVVCEVVEGDITKVEYLFLDKLGNVVDGNTSIPVIDRELPHQLRPGHIYNYGARKQALKNIDSLGLFSTVEVQPRPDETNQGGVIVAIKLKEHDPKSAQVITDWSIVPGSQGRPTLVTCHWRPFNQEELCHLSTTTSVI